MPSPGYEYMYNATTLNITLDRDTSLSIPLLNYNLTLTLLDSLTNSKPVTPLMLIVDDIVAVRNLTSVTYVLGLSPGDHIIRVEPEPLFIYSYVPQEFTLTMSKDMTYVIELKRRTYELTLQIIDPEGSVVAPLNVYVNETLIISNTSEQSLRLTLVFGNYSISIRPLLGYKNAYEELNFNVSMRGNLRKEITLQRKYYMLKLRVTDKLLAGEPIDLVRVYVDDVFINETKEFPLYINLTYGPHKIKVEPADPKIYESAEESVFINGNMSKVINVDRKRYTIAVTVQNDIGEPAHSAFVRAYSEIGTYQDITDVRGTGFLIVPYGTYTLEISYPGYIKFIQAIDVNNNRELTVVLKPTIQTLIIRFLPIIITAVSALAIVIVFLKLRAKIAEKVLASEEYF